ncbi:hypothetical protein [Micromonospora maris]|uniref:hypothetical protein n=1 Tax=Micromonospora maris TaxID=1003110 RepID=UPI0011D184C7|nr:hypothetical protein [Micromonospora maris]
MEIPILITVSTNTQEPFEGEFSLSAGMSWTENNPVETRKRFTFSVVDNPEADLSVIAWDVDQSVPIDAGPIGPDPHGPLNPGEAGGLQYLVANHGRKAVSGLKVTIRLPKGVTFIYQDEPCVIDSDGPTAVCTYDRLALVGERRRRTGSPMWTSATTRTVSPSWSPHSPRTMAGVEVACRSPVRRPG